jgi:hypothetical protein
MTLQLIETKTLSSAAASIEFTSIPQDGTDLLVLFSVRSQRAGNLDDPLGFRLNGTTTGYSWRQLYGNGGAVFTSGATDSAIFAGFLPAATATANTFHNGAVYVPNYTASANKSASVDSVSENNGANAYQSIVAGLWSNTAAITSLTFLSYQTGSNLSAGSTISLYKITKGSDGIVTTS